MKYLFILGRNIELSKAEVFSYFEREGNKILEVSENKNGLLVETEKSVPENSIEALGGVVAIGGVILESPKKELLKRLDEIILYSGTGNKLNYALWNFSKSYNDVLEYLKKRFKKEKLKATLKHMKGKIDSQEGEELEIPSSKLLDEKFFIFESKEKTFCQV